MQFAGGKSRSAGGMIALRAIVCFANADERCSSLQILGTNAICRRQMTIRDRIIHTGCIALAGDLFRLRRNRARGYAPLRETGRVGTRPYAKPGAWIRAPTRNPARGYAPLRGTGRVGTRPYEAIGGEKGPRHKPRAQGCRGLTPPAGLQSFDRVRANYSSASFGAMSRHRKVTIWARVQPSVRPDSVSVLPV